MGTKSPGGPQRCRLILQRCLAIQLSKPGHTPEDFWMYDSGYMIFQVSSKSKLRELVSREIHELVTIIHQPPSTTVQCPFSLVPSSLCSTAVMSSLCLRLCSELSSVNWRFSAPKCVFMYEKWGGRAWALTLKHFSKLQSSVLGGLIPGIYL